MSETDTLDACSEAAVSVSRVYRNGHLGHNLSGALQMLGTKAKARM